jgi:hypothetical protein
MHTLTSPLVAFVTAEWLSVEFSVTQSAAGEAPRVLTASVFASLWSFGRSQDDPTYPDASDTLTFGLTMTANVEFGNPVDDT